MNQQQRQMLIHTLVALRTMALDKKRTLLSLRSEHSVMYRQARQTFRARECSNDELDEYLWIGVTRFCRRAVLLNDIEDLLTYARQQQTEAARKVQDTVLTIDSAFNESRLPGAIAAVPVGEAARVNAEHVWTAAINAATSGHELPFIVAGLFGEPKLMDVTDDGHLRSLLVNVFNTTAEILERAK